LETKLLMDIAAIYGYPLNKNEVLPIAGGLLAGGAVYKVGVMEVIGFLPGIGSIIKGGAAAAFIVALGEASVRFFEKKRFNLPYPLLEGPHEHRPQLPGA
jgi:uncharacterized protein (DUF697 family)